MSHFDYKPSYHRRLPHIQPPGVTLFITFRLAGSIPAELLRWLLEESEQVEKRLAKIDDPTEHVRQSERERRRLFGKWDKALDSAEWTILVAR